MKLATELLEAVAVSDQRPVEDMDQFKLALKNAKHYLSELFSSLRYNETPDRQKALKAVVGAKYDSSEVSSAISGFKSTHAVKKADMEAIVKSMSKFVTSFGQIKSKTSYLSEEEKKILNNAVKEMTNLAAGLRKITVAVKNSLY